MAYASYKHGVVFFSVPNCTAAKQYKGKEDKKKEDKICVKVLSWIFVKPAALQRKKNNLKFDFHRVLYNKYADK
jgi:hypothetical protein